MGRQMRASRNLAAAFTLHEGRRDKGLALATWQTRSAFQAGGHHHASNLDTKAGLAALAVFAFTLGFVHEEEFQIIAMCAGSGSCLSLMLIYATAVIVALVVLTLLLIQGLSHLSHRIEHAQHALTLVSASILALMGLGFLIGFF